MMARARRGCCAMTLVVPPRLTHFARVTPPPPPRVGAVEDDPSQYAVSTACELRFQGACRVSSPQDGISPQWNEALALPFNPPRGDYTPMNLQSVTDCVVIALFDEVRACVWGRI